MGTYLGKICDKHPELLGRRYESSKKCKACQTERNLVYKSSPNGEQYRKRASKRGSARIRKGTPLYQQKLARNKRWYENNKHWFKARNTAKKLGVMVPIFLLHKKELKQIYNDCPGGMVIDHIIPLKGLDPDTKEHVVSGLHVPWNLQYLTPEDNATKWAWFR